VVHPLHAKNVVIRKTTLLLLVVAAAFGPARIDAEDRCADRPESSQFDFWLGDWEVGPTAGQPDDGTRASSREEKIIGGCVLLENYEEQGGYSGKSLNFFDPVRKKWRQMWVDSAGNTSEFEGAFADGAMRFEGESHMASGKRVFRRLTFTPLTADSVRQRSEASLDGKTWKVNYDYTYARRKR
jgi:hypothetical protein